MLLLLVMVSHAGATPLFEDDAVLAFSLTGPIGILIDNKNDREEMPFVLTVGDSEFEVGVRVRGHSRVRVCDFPPLRLNVAKKQGKATVFAGQHRLKLVTHCGDRESDQAYVLKEYAAYRLFNLLSDIGYRVRLVQVTYVDSGKGMEDSPIVRYGVLIESDRELAKRTGAKRLKLPGVSLKSFEQQDLATVFVFQYLIGNTDWSLVAAEDSDSCCHNGHILEIQDYRYLVPYDFDLTGLVNTRYARPDASLSISRVTQRLYRGYCISPQVTRNAISAVADKEHDIMKVPAQVPGLGAKDVKKMQKFLDKYFDQASDVDKLARSFEKRCL